MAEGRGLLTEKERRAIAGELSDSYRYKTRSYFRGRLDELAEDVAVLDAEAPDLLEELREVVRSGTDGHGAPAHAPRETAENAPRADAVDAPADGPLDPPADAHGAHAVGEEDLAEVIREYMAENDIPPKTEHGRGAVIDVFDYLREHERAKTGEIQTAVYPEYDTEWSTARTMWNALDRYLDDVPGVEKAGYGEWGYAGDDAVRAEVDS